MFGLQIKYRNSILKKIFEPKIEVEHFLIVKLSIRTKRLIELKRERERDTDKCILFIFRLGSNPRYQFTLHTALTLKH